MMPRGNKEFVRFPVEHIEEAMRKKGYDQQE
jgi:hypothetical protein